MKIINILKNFLKSLNVFPIEEYSPYILYQSYKKIYGKKFADSLIGKTDQEIDAIFLKRDQEKATENIIRRGEVAKQLKDIINEELKFSDLYEQYKDATTGSSVISSMHRTPEYKRLLAYALHKKENDKLELLLEMQSYFEKNPMQPFFCYSLIKNVLDKEIEIDDAIKGKVESVSKVYKKEIRKAIDTILNQFYK